MFDSNGEPLFNDLKFFDTYVEKMPIGMKRKSIIYEHSYWKHLKIVHLLDPMHIFINVSSSLWRHISSKKVTYWLLREILFLRILKIDIDKEKKVEERLVPLGLLKKVMFHGS